MSKRMQALLLAAVLGLTLSAQALAAPAGYSDVPAGHWAAGEIRQASQLGIFQGVGGGKFGVGQPITRGAFVTALVRLMGWQEVRPAVGSFSDVASQAWYYPAVETARANGALVTGSRSFRPTESITREEMAAMLVRGLGYAPLAGALSGEKAPFSDVRTNSGFITVAYDLGLVGGTGGGLFDPDGAATREQAAAVMVRLYRRLHAQSVRLSSADGHTVISVPTAEATAEQALPTTPLEPLTELYAALHREKAAGTDLGGAALRLCAGGVRTVTGGGRILQTDALTEQEVAQLLERQDVRTYYSDRYESAYCIYRPNPYQSATVWYQSGESLAAKLQLARLFGVTRYILE